MSLPEATAAALVVKYSDGLDNSNIISTATHDMVMVDTSGGDVLLTLEECTAGQEGQQFYIRKATTDFNKVTVKEAAATTTGSIEPGIFPLTTPCARPMP